MQSHQQNDENQTPPKSYLKANNSADIYKNGHHKSLLEQQCTDLEQSLASEKAKNEKLFKLYNELKNTQLKNSNIEVNYIFLI
jgi:hypothetical protein